METMQRRFPAPKFKENIAHRVAKETLYQWLIGDNWPFDAVRVGQETSGYQVWMEFPFTPEIVDVPDFQWYEDYEAFFLHGHGVVRNANGSGYFPQEAWPGKDVAFVSDIAILSKGYAAYAIEIVNKTPVSPKKRAFFSSRSVSLIEVPASSVIQQFDVPAKLKGCRLNGKPMVVK